MLILGVRRFKEVDINVINLFNAHAHEVLLRETAGQPHIKLTGTLLTCSGCVQAKSRRASVPTVTSSRMTQSLRRVFVDRVGPWGGSVPDSVLG